ncbi:MAG TPA: VWA domain-containing protein [Pyrinomonadaceae bacterium]|nr:VWA domain-containing protein [Pyrinomonadaceae bacterium]
MRRSIFRAPVISFLTLALLTVSLAQSPARKRKQIKDFGSSLKRLKWNPEKNTAVDTNGDSTELNEGDVIRIDTSLVSCELLVLDKQGNAVTELTAKDFSIAEDDTPQKVEHFFSGDNVSVPRTIVLIIDYSGSQFPYLKNSVAAAHIMVDKLAPKDRMAIITDDVDLLVDFTDDKKKLKEGLDELLDRTKLKTRFWGGTKLRVGRSMQYSALMATLNEAFDEEDVRPIIIFQTDGDEAVFLRNPSVVMTPPVGLEGEALQKAQQSFQFHQKELLKNVTEFSLEDLYRAVERSRATIYTVLPGPKLIGLSIEEQAKKLRADRHASQAEILTQVSSTDAKKKVRARMDRDEKNFTEAYDRWRAELRFKQQSALAGVAPLTGGWTEFLETPAEADQIYARIFSDINQRYIVGYYPTNKERDGKRRKIDFEVKGHPEYQIFGRRSYFAPRP